MADVWVNSMVCHARATCHIAGCCHPANSVTCHSRATCHCMVGLLPLGEFTVMIAEPRATLQGAATWRIQCHDPSATCHIAGCSHLAKSMSWSCNIAGCMNSIRYIENRFSPYLPRRWCILISSFVCFFLSRFGMTKFVITETIWSSIIFKTIMVSLHTGRFVVVHLCSSFPIDPQNFSRGANFYKKIQFLAIFGAVRPLF